MLRNSFFQKFSNVSWHSARHFPQFHNKKFLVLQNELPLPDLNNNTFIMESDSFSVHGILKGQAM